MEDIVTKKDRLDRLLVELKRVPTRARAKALIMSGRVKVDGEIIDKAGSLVRPDSDIEITEGPEFVSRGGEKLEHAIDHFRPQLEGRVALDVGASTGGFTDCLLKHGVRKVYAVDVGYGQLAWTIRKDPRVVVMDRINARNLKRSMLEEQPEIAVIDVSFISLTLVLAPVADALVDKGKILALIKPQFEAGRDKVGKGGVVRDPKVHKEVIGKVTAHARRLGLLSRGTVESPILGPAGNREFFVCLEKDAGSISRE